MSSPSYRVAARGENRLPSLASEPDAGVYYLRSVHSFGGPKDGSPDSFGFGVNDQFFIIPMKLPRVICLLVGLALWSTPVPAVTSLILHGPASTNSYNEPPNTDPSDPAIQHPPPGALVMVGNPDTNSVINSRISPGERLTRPVREVMKMAKADVSVDLLTSYIQNSTSTFNLTPENIIYLKSIGFPAPLITAMLSHDRTLQETFASESNASGPQPTAAGLPPLTSVPPAESPENSSPLYPQYQPQAYAVPSDQYAAPVYDQPMYDAYYTPSDAGAFYSSLSPYGGWYNYPGYGACWQPYCANTPGWTPYCNDGRWFYSNYGWYWHSYYPWGWAPFHYGRWWHNSQVGWLWFPGSTWAPSWVNWRTSGNYCGWTPCSPFPDSASGWGMAGQRNWGGHERRHGGDHDANDYTFVPFQHFGDRNLSRWRLSGNQAQQILPITTPVNHNFAPAGSSVMMNRGLSPVTIFNRSQTPVLRITVQDPPAGASSVVADRLQVASTGNSGFSVYRPVLQAGRQPSTLASLAIDPMNPSAGYGALPGQQPSTEQSWRLNPQTTPLLNNSAATGNTSGYQGGRLPLSSYYQLPPNLNPTAPYLTPPGATRYSAPGQPQVIISSAGGAGGVGAGYGAGSGRGAGAAHVMGGGHAGVGGGGHR